MSDKMGEEISKCAKHGNPISLYCDEESCKAFLCRTCLNEENHENHKIYGWGLLKVLPVNSAIKTRADKLCDLINKIKEIENDLKAHKTLSETYKEDVEKIYSTQIGKSLLSQGGRDKIQLTDSIENITKSLKNYLEKIDQINKNAETERKGFELKHIINEAKSVEGDALDKAVEKLGSSVMSEGFELLEQIRIDNFPEQLETFKENFTAPLSSSGKRRKSEEASSREEKATIKRNPKKVKALEEKKEKPKRKYQKKKKVEEQ